MHKRKTLRVKIINPYTPQCIATLNGVKQMVSTIYLNKKFLVKNKFVIITTKIFQCNNLIILGPRVLFFIGRGCGIHQKVVSLVCFKPKTRIPYVCLRNIFWMDLFLEYDGEVLSTVP